MQLRSGLRFVIVFLGSVLLDGAIFGSAHPMSWWYAGTWWSRSGKYATPGFEMIEDVRAVYVQIRQAQRRGLENN
jgi:hypothetical protein